MLQQHEQHELNDEKDAQRAASCQIAGQEARRLFRAERIRRQKAQTNPQSATLRVADWSVTEDGLNGWKTLRGAPLPSCPGDAVWPVDRDLIDRIAGGPARLDHARMRRVLDYIDQHLEVDFTISDLAEVAYLSEFHFARVFATTMGLPPQRYVSQQRLAAAKKMIGVGKLPLSEIAFRSGFSSPASFTRASPPRYQHDARRVQAAHPLMAGHRVWPETDAIGVDNNVAFCQTSRMSV